MTDTKYTAIYTKTKTGYSAFIPDLPGCIATGPTLSETQKRMQEAADLHIKGMQEDGDPIPEPITFAGNIESAA